MIDRAALGHEASLLTLRPAISTTSKMKSHSLVAGQSTVALPVASPAELLAQRLDALYALAQKNRHVFASPLGTVSFGGRDALLPRFVFFGPNTTDVSWRLAFLAGFDREDLRATHALLGLIDFLSHHAEHGYGLNLSFFPIIDIAGAAFRAPARQLAGAHWAHSVAPEIMLLEKDARNSGYHGYVRIETAAVGEDVIGVRMRTPSGVPASPDVEIVTTRDFEPYPVRFESGGTDQPTDGPLSIADDLPVQPFELTFRIPPTWSDDIYQTAVNLTLSRFILRYRAFQAYGMHL